MLSDWLDLKEEIVRAFMQRRESASAPSRASLPLVFGDTVIALLWSVLNALLLTWRIIAVLLMVFVVSACGMGGPAHGPPASNAAVVGMGFTSYSPAEVTVGVGDTVEWRNTSIITHTVTNDPGRAEKQGDASLPARAQPFDSGNIPAGQVYRRTFTVPGTYRYFCTHH